MSSLQTITGYKLEYFGTRTNNPVDVTPYVESIDKFTDVGNGEIPTAQIMLDTREGEFMTNTTGGDTPVISQYDVFRVTIEDYAGNTYMQFMTQDDVAPQKNDTGRHLIIDLVGMERHLQKMNFTGYYPFVGMHTMLGIIRDWYNRNKGSSQPSMTYYAADLDALPKYTFGTFNFNQETTAYDALQEVMHRLSLPVAAAGAGERYSLVVSDVDSNAHAMALHVIPRGRRPDARNVITVTNPMNLTRRVSPEEGNVTVVTGQVGTGSFPKEIAEFRSIIEEYENIPAYDATIKYKMDSYVSHSGFVYQARHDLTAGTTPPSAAEPDANWWHRTLGGYVTEYQKWRNGGNPVTTTFQYSPWTQDKAVPWRNAGGKPYEGSTQDTTPGFQAASMPDCNLVIREAGDGGDGITVWRDWVDFKVSGTKPPANLGGTPYNGMRCIVLTADRLTGMTGTTDSFGKKWQDSMCQYWNGQWVVFRTPQQFDQCCIINDGETWEYAEPHDMRDGKAIRRTHRWLASQWHGKQVGWRNASSTTLGNDAFHYPYRMRNVEGLIGADVDGNTIIGNQYTRQSAIEVEYRHAISLATIATAAVVAPIQNFFMDLWDLVTGTEIGKADAAVELKPFDDTTSFNQLYEADAYSQGWWCTLFEAPFPKADNNISESVGRLFNAPLLDTNNLNTTPAGGTSFIQPDADLLGTLDGIGFFFYFDIIGLTLNNLFGNIPFRCVIYDIFGGVWKSDLVIRFQKETQFIKIPFSSFTNYRARLPVAYVIANWVHKTRNPELLETEIFQNHHIKRIVLHCLLPYDDQGRYDPFKIESLINNILPTFTGGIRYIGRIDAFHFTKTPVAINKTGETTRHTMANIRKYPQVSNVVQLQKISRAEHDITRHQQDVVEFQIDDVNNTPNVCALVAEQTIRVMDDSFISESETDGSGDTAVTTMNARDYIVDKITYSVGDRATGSGITATIIASRRIAT